MESIKSNDISGISSMNMRFIKTNQIRGFTKSPCNVVNSSFITELAASILEQGIQVPILVKRLSDTSYEIIDGNKRLMACQNAGIDEIPAVIREIKDEREQIIIALITNLQRHTLTPLEIAQSIDVLLKMEMSQHDIAKRIGKSQGWVHVRHTILNLEPEVQKLAGPETPPEKRLTQSQAYLIADLPKEPQIEIAKKISEEGLNMADARRMVVEKVQTENIPLKKNTSRLNLIEDLKKFTKFVGRTSEYLDNFLGIEKNKFYSFFNSETVSDMDELIQKTEEISQSTTILIESLKEIKNNKLSNSTDVQIVEDDDEIDEKKAEERMPEVNAINLRTASTTQLLYYLGLHPHDVYIKRPAGAKVCTFWKRPVDHMGILEKAKKKYIDRIKEIHPDITQNTTENAGILNAAWEIVEHRFKLHGFELKKQI